MEPTDMQISSSPRPLLKPSTSTPYAIDFELLAQQGWISIPIAPCDPSTGSSPDPLYKPYSSLLCASAQFFALPDAQKNKYDFTQKDRFRPPKDPEGYDRVHGEKEFVTMRQASTTPTEFELRDKASEAWRASADVMYTVLSAIEESLEMEKGALERTAGPQRELPMGEKEVPVVASFLRVFKYERPTTPDDSSGNTPNPISQRAVEGDLDEDSLDTRIVSEEHRDRGLLTIVIGHSPGLECWSPSQQAWIACEEPYLLSASDSSDTEGTPRLCVTLLAGKTLSEFTNNRYAAGWHRVLLSKPRKASEESSPLFSPAHRFSLVHTLRAHYPVRVSSSAFTTPITGAFESDAQFEDVSVRELFEALSKNHWNVNFDPDVQMMQHEAAMRLKDGVEEFDSDFEFDIDSELDDIKLD